LHSRSELALDAPAGSPDHWASGAVLQRSVRALLQKIARADTLAGVECQGRGQWRSSADCGILQPVSCRRSAVVLMLDHCRSAGASAPLLDASTA